MEVTVRTTPESKPAELRALAMFMNTLAAMKGDEKAAALVPAPPVAAEVAEPPAEQEKPARTARGKKGNAAPAEEPKQEAAAAVEEAPPAEQAAPAEEQKPEPAATEQKAYDHDSVRKLIGELSQAGKRNEAIAAVRSFKKADGAMCNGVSDIQEADLPKVMAALDKIQRGA